MLQTSFIAQPTVFSTHLALHDLYNCLQLTVIYNLGLWNLMLYKYHILKTSPKVFSASKRKMEILWNLSLRNDILRGNLMLMYCDLFAKVVQNWIVTRSTILNYMVFLGSYHTYCLIFFPNWINYKYWTISIKTHRTVFYT